MCVCTSTFKMFPPQSGSLDWFYVNHPSSPRCLIMYSSTTSKLQILHRLAYQNVSWKCLGCQILVKCQNMSEHKADHIGWQCENVCQMSIWQRRMSEHMWEHVRRHVRRHVRWTYQITVLDNVWDENVGECRRMSERVLERCQNTCPCNVTWRGQTAFHRNMSVSVVMDDRNHVR